MVVKICKILRCAPWLSGCALGLCGKFADEIFGVFAEKYSFRKNCPKRPETACFYPNGSKMVVNFLFKISLKLKIRGLDSRVLAFQAYLKYLRFRRGTQNRFG